MTASLKIRGTGFSLRNESHASRIKRTGLSPRYECFVFFGVSSLVVVFIEQTSCEGCGTRSDWKAGSFMLIHGFPVQGFVRLTQPIFMSKVHYFPAICAGQSYPSQGCSQLCIQLEATL